MIAVELPADGVDAEQSLREIRGSATTVRNEITKALHLLAIAAKHMTGPRHDIETARDTLLEAMGALSEANAGAEHCLEECSEVAYAIGVESGE